MRLRIRIKELLLYVFVIVAIASYFPTIYDSPRYETAIGVLSMVMVVLFAFSINNNYFYKNPLLLKYLAFLVLFALELWVFSLGGLRYRSDDLRQLVIILICIVVGYSLDFAEDKINSLCLFYSFACVLLGFSSLYGYTGGVSFAGDRNMIDGKNQVGGILSVGASVALYRWMSGTKRNKMFLALVIILFFLLAFVRCRSAFLGFIVFLFLMLLKKYPSNIIFLGGLGVGILYLVFKSQIDAFFANVFITSRGSEDINDFSTGRMNRFLLGVDYFKNHLFDGELYRRSNIPQIHNFLLLRMVRYGVWSVFIICIYMLLLLKVLSEYFHLRHGSIPSYKIGFLILFIPFFVSMMEPSFPFGPGSVQSFAFILFGYSLKKEQYINSF